MEQVWFVLGCTSPRHELKVRDDARRYGLQSFVPLKYEVKNVRGREQRQLVPALSRYIFVRGTLDEVQDYTTEWLRIVMQNFLMPDGEFVVFGDPKQNVYHRPIDSNGDIRNGDDI